MLDQLLNFNQEQKLFQPDEKILLAVSGGIDSMVMVDLFQKAGFNYAIAHCNFQLRGEESVNDKTLVNEVANKHKVQCFNKDFFTEEHAMNHGISIQMAARDLRRSWFDELIKKNDCSYIATAHHLNDSLETVLFNLTKGTGIAGLKGILPKNQQYVRPLMYASREIIDAYARENDILWREDQSNISIKYHRNLIRHKVVPELRKINPNLEATFSQTAEKLAASERVFTKYIDQIRGEVLLESKDGFKISKVKANSFAEPLIVFYEILKDFGFNYLQVKNVLSSLEQQSGKTYLTENYQLIIDRKYLFLSKRISRTTENLQIRTDTSSVSTKSTQITFEEMHPSGVKYSKEDNTVFLDFDKLQFPLIARPWKKGDKFQPLGMKHKKKLSDFMIDKKIPLNLKEQVLVLVSGENIVWVIGHRIDERFKITQQTKKAYKICNIIKND